VFNCPSDPNPKPCPAFLIDMFYSGTAMAPPPYVTASPDNPFARFGKSSSKADSWTVGMADRISDDWLGFNGDVTDLVFTYTAPAGAKMTKVTFVSSGALDDFRIRSYKGVTLIPVLKSVPGSKFDAPLVWGSYGMNIAAGYRTTKGNPILLAEYSTWAIFPEKITNAHDLSTVYPADNFTQKLRLRHGGAAPASAGLRDTTDKTYAPKSLENCSFQDGHVERLSWEKLLNNQSALWLGNRGVGFNRTF
jgi:hypothetical protein